MTTFSSDVLKSPEMEDPKKQKRYMDELEASSIAAQRQFGRGQAVGQNRFQSQESANQALSQEQQRRASASQDAFNLASSIDERVAGTRNQLQSLYDKYGSTVADLTQKQGQGAAETAWQTKAGLEEVAQKRGNLDFTLYKSAADRKDALLSAMSKGNADQALQDAANAGRLKIQDAENYWDKILNDINQDLADYKQASDIEYMKWGQQLQRDASNWGSILSGVMTIGGATIGAIYGGGTGSVIGANVGGSIGRGLA